VNTEAVVLYGVQASFLQRYLQAFSRIEGWYQFEAALLFMRYNQLVREDGIDGDVLEIGVYHGLSTIAMAQLRSESRRLVVIDPFDDAGQTNKEMYGTHIRTMFERNFASFYPKAPFLHVIGRSSSDVSASELCQEGGSFSFCHIDGGHSREETFSDLSLCEQLLAAGGLIALDDYFNPQHPGVVEGAIEFFLRKPNAIRPLAAGFNKVIFQKAGGAPNMNERFLECFRGAKYEVVKMWDSPTLLFGGTLRNEIDLYASSPEHFVRIGEKGPRLLIRPATAALQAGSGKQVKVAVDVENVSKEPTPCGKGTFGLSYHLLSQAGEVLQHDNDRTWVEACIQPGEKRRMELALKSPAQPGKYGVELDFVWEGVMWFKDVANPTARLSLTVA